MKKIEYELKEQIKTLTTEDFYNRFNNFEFTQSFCRKCFNYNQNFSCSPLEINIKDYILDFEYVDVIVTQLFFKKDDYTKEYSKEELDDIIKQTFIEEKKKVKNKLLTMENEYSKAESITGPCDYCKIKCKNKYDKCIYPDKKRYSLSSLGIDSEKILKDLFSIKLILIEGKLPKYMNNVSAILYNK